MVRWTDVVPVLCGPTWSITYGSLAVEFLTVAAAAVSSLLLLLSLEATPPPPLFAADDDADMNDSSICNDGDDSVGLEFCISNEASKFGRTNSMNETWSSIATRMQRWKKNPLQFRLRRSAPAAVLFPDIVVVAFTLLCQCLPK